ncbi:MAG: hypothetical protein K6A38_05080 [Lachnospiraceae bacterium]|nr:hypothetical protein [Lachnospiraceae bacterium]
MNIQQLKIKEKKLRAKQKNGYSDKRADKINKIHKKRMKGVVKNSTVLSALSRIPTYVAIIIAALFAVERFEENIKRNIRSGREN